MKSPQPVPVKPEKPTFKIKIDYKTIITFRSTDALELWMKKYPNAKLV